MYIRFPHLVLRLTILCINTSLLFAMAPTTFFNRGIGSLCHSKMNEYHGNGNYVQYVAFAPGGGDKFTILTDTPGVYYNSNVPEGAKADMATLSASSGIITRVAYHKNGGWSVVNHRGGYYNRNTPGDFHDACGEASKNGAKIVHVAFTPDGSGWVVINDAGKIYSKGLPSSCESTLRTQEAAGTKVVCVAFAPAGGDNWAIIGSGGGFTVRGPFDELLMYQRYFNQVNGKNTAVTFDLDGSGWSVIAADTKDETVADATQKVLIRDVYSNIAKKMNGNVVGWAATVGDAAPRGALSHGEARTAADGGSIFFSPDTKVPVASVSKAVTAFAAVAVLHKYNLPLDTTTIGKYFPSTWKVDPFLRSLTFQDLLGQRTGIKDYGNGDNSYAKLKWFFEKPVNMGSATMCQGSDKYDVVDAVNPNLKNTYCYSNYNFAIIRILLPYVDGFVQDTGSSAPGLDRQLADRYVSLVQKHVFEPVGITGVFPKPPAGSQNYAHSYEFPGNTAGYDWGDMTLGVGGAGWYLSINDISAVLHSLNSRDGKIVPAASHDIMENLKLGYDANNYGGYRWIEKNGGFGAGVGSSITSISTSIALFGPGVYGALFMNSDYLGPNRQSQWKYCSKCHVLHFARGGSGACAAGGMHDPTGSGNYRIQHGGTVPTNGQSNWRYCAKCKALHFAGGASLGKCPAGGSHSTSGSGDYVMHQVADTDPVPKNSQNNWRYCKKCSALHWNSGACSAGGMHDQSASGNYLLDRVIGADTVLLDSYMDALKPV